MSDMQDNHKDWLKTAKEMGAKYVLDVCDTFDYEHYPVYVMENEDVNEIRSKYDAKSMQSVFYTINVE